MKPKYHIAKRKYIIDIFKSLLSSFFIALFSISVLYDKGEEEILELTSQQSTVITVIFFSCIIVQLVVYWLILRRYRFIDLEKSFLIEKGLFFKKKLEIPYKNIHTVSLKRKFTDLILGISVVQFDTGTTSTLIPEAHIALDKEYALVLKDFIEKRKNNVPATLQDPKEFNKVELETSDYLYQPKWQKLMLMGLYKPAFLYFFLFFTLTILLSSSITLYLVEENEVLFTTLVFIYIYLGVIIIGALSFMVFNLVRYFNYRLKIEGDEITYQYGLLSKNEFKFSKRRVNAVHISQSLFYTLFHYYDLSISAIGIGDQIGNDQNKVESKSLIPIAKKDIIIEMLNYLGYKEMDEVKKYKPDKYRILNFIIIPLALITSIFVIPYVFIKMDINRLILPFIFNVISYAFCSLGLHLYLKNHCFSVENDIFRFKKGAFNVKETYIKRVKIQMISQNQNPILLLENLGNISIHYKDLMGVIRMNCFSNEDFRFLINKLGV